MLGAAPTGLSTAQAAERLQSYGLNEIQERRAKGALAMLWEQFTQTMVLILLAAAGVALLLGKGLEAAAILAIVVLFALLGFLQEHRAERAMAALRGMAVPRVRARRDGAVKELSARELVPGDVVLLEAGGAVPADLRLLESASLRIQESALTGESEPVEKDTEPLGEADLPLGDRRNLAYLGTAVTYGRGSGVVTATGMDTELGRIARLLQQTPPVKTPLQRRLAGIGRVLAIAGVAAALAVLGIGLAAGEPLLDMLLTAVSVAVAVVPEGLPAVVTITLSLGAQRMLRRNALVRRLPAVETLGSVTVICSDKTGTLTENRMSVTVVDVAGERLDLSESLRHHRPAAAEDSLDPLRSAPAAIRLTLAAAALCNDAQLQPGSTEGGRGGWHALGDPTEGALLVAAARAGLAQPQLAERLPRIAELPFDSGRKRMTTVHRGDGRLPEPFADLPGTGALALIKGAVDGLLGLCSAVWDGRLELPLDGSWRERIRSATEELAGAGMRVLGVAFRRLEEGMPAGKPSAEELERNLVFVGLVGMMDPPRAAALPAVDSCRQAGIRVLMITGDHPLTAAAVAAQLRLAEQPRIVAAEALARLDAAGLDSAVQRATVFARVSPEDKLRIVEALQRQGQVVAMTGDGVNDSPALKKADIGVAMGVTGTDVAKEAADIVLLDDNFATIVAAVEEGRLVFENLVRFVKLSLGGNIGKILVMLAGPLLGLTVALRPLQLLWLNLITDGLLGLGMSVEPAESDTMRRPPRRPGSPLLDGPSLVHVGWVGPVLAALTLGLAVLGTDAARQSLLFAALGFSQIGHALGLRALGRSALSFRSNPLMMSVALGGLGLQLGVLYAPFLEEFFQISPLSLPQLSLALACGVVTFLAVRLEKVLRARAAARGRADA